MSGAIPLSGHERRRRQTAARIVEAAGHLFAERGVAATTVADVCDRAGVARQTFFNHFGSKQELAAALARLGQAFFLDALEQARERAPGVREQLAWVLREIHTSAAAAGPMHQDLISAVIGASYDDAGSSRVRELHRGVERLLRAGRLRGEVSRDHALEDQVLLVLGAVQSLLIEWSHRPDFRIAERSERLADLLADALRGRRNPRARP